MPSGWNRSSSTTDPATSTKPAQVAKMPPSKVWRFSRIRFLSMRRAIVVDSPPGIAIASRVPISSARRISRHARRLHQKVRTRARSATSPCSASTPISRQIRRPRILTVTSSLSRFPVLRYSRDTRLRVLTASTPPSHLQGSLERKMPDPTKTPSAPSCIIIAASEGVAMPPAEKFTTGSR